MSKANKILGININNAIAKGSKYIQHNSIKASYLNLGKVALNKTNIKQKIQVFKPNIIACKLIIVLLIKISGVL